MRKRSCPKCGADMEWTDGEEDVGINAGWWCEPCQEAIAADAEDYDDGE